MKFIHLVFILLLLAGCKGCDETATPENKKPEPTTDGRNTFYCEINGVPHYQKMAGNISVNPTITGAYDSSSGYGEIDIRVTYPNYEKSEYLILYGRKVRTKGTYNVDTSSKSFDCCYWRKNSCSYLDNYRYNSMNGVVKLNRCDFISGIFSGEFTFKVWLPDSIRGSCDTVKITNGIFDIKL